MPGGCKSILNVKVLHKSHMAKLFGPRVFCFSVGQKKVWSGNFGDFQHDLKNNFNIFFFGESTPSSKIENEESARSEKSTDGFSHHFVVGLGIGIFVGGLIVMGFSFSALELLNRLNLKNGTAVFIRFAGLVVGALLLFSGTLIFNAGLAIPTPDSLSYVVKSFLVFLGFVFPYGFIGVMYVMNV